MKNKKSIASVVVLALALVACVAEPHDSSRLAGRKIGGAVCARVYACSPVSFALQWGKGTMDEGVMLAACTQVAEDAVVQKTGRDKEPGECTSAEVDACVRDVGVMACEQVAAGTAPASCGGC